MRYYERLCEMMYTDQKPTNLKLYLNLNVLAQVLLRQL